MDSLPIELLDIVAGHDMSVYYGLLGYKFFTDRLTYGKRVDYMILFGHSVEITESDIRWTKKGQLHRADGPAIQKIVVRTNSHNHSMHFMTYEWWLNGVPKSVSGPTVETTPLTEWCSHDCPYMEHAKLIWLDEKGFRHRVDGPAMEFFNGSMQWYQNNQRHRDNDLPAVICDGGKIWYKHDQVHRLNDLPAIENANGDKKWYLNGECHRDNDLPAIEYANGTKQWYQNGKLHRGNDLPAIEHLNGTKEWYCMSKRHRTYGPSVIEHNGTQKWYFWDRLHRKYGPAVLNYDESGQCYLTEWYRDGRRHRKNGPAVEPANGPEVWYLYGVQVNPNT